MDYPYVHIGAIDVTDAEKRASVELRFGEITLPGVTEQDVVDALKTFLAAQPNASVTALRYEVASTTV